MAYQKYLSIPNRRGNVGDRDHFQHIENALQSVVPGPGEVIVGSADGPEARSSGVFMASPRRTMTYIPMGDSITDGGSSYTTAPGDVWQHGKASWTQFLTARSQRRMHMLRNAALSGDSTTGMLSRLQAQVIDHRPDMCIILGGANDISANVPVETVRQNFREMHRRLHAAGIQMVLCSLTPRNPDDATDPTRLRRTLELSAWLRQYALDNHLQFIDFYAVTADPATGGWKAGYSNDMLHPSQKAAQVMGEHAVKTLLGEIPTEPGVMLPVSNADPTNLITNGLFMTDANSDGMPDGWNVAGVSGGIATSTLVPGDTIPGNWIKVTRTGAGTIRLGQQVTTGDTGDVLALMGRIRTENMEATGGVWDLLVRWMNGTTVVSASYYPIGADKEVDVDTSVFYVELPPKPSDATFVDFRVPIDANGGSIFVGQVALRNLTQLGLV